VRRDRRRQGVGGSLIREMRAWLRANGFRTAWTLADNPGAEGFYMAMGFQRKESMNTCLERET